MGQEQNVVLEVDRKEEHAGYTGILGLGQEDPRERTCF